MAGFFPTQSVQEQILWLKRKVLCCCDTIGDFTGYDPSNYTETANTVVGHLEGIDDALASVGGDGVVDGVDVSGGIGGTLSLTRTIPGNVDISLSVVSALIDANLLVTTPTVPFVGANLQAALDEIYTALNTPVVGDDLGDHIMDQNLETSGFWISNDGLSEGIFIDGSNEVGINKNTPTELLNLGEGNLLLDKGDISIDDGILYQAASNTQNSNFTNFDLNFIVNPGVNQNPGIINTGLSVLMYDTSVNDVGIMRGIMQQTTLSSSGSVSSSVGEEIRLLVTDAPVVTGGIIGMFSSVLMSAASAGFTTQDVDSINSYINIGNEGTFQDVTGLRIDIVHGGSNAQGQDVSGINIAGVGAGLDPASWQNRYGILIADTANDAGVAGEDMVIKSENTKDSEFAGLINYASDLSGGYVNRSLVDKEYVDGLIAGAVPTIYNISGGLTTPTTLTDGANALNFTGTGTRSHTSGAYSNVITGADFSNTVGTLGTTTGYKWGAGGFTGSSNAGFNIVNNDASFENVFALINTGAVSVLTQQIKRLSDNYANTLQINQSFINLLSDDGVNVASLVVDAKTSPRVAASITDGTDTGEFLAKPGEAWIKATGVTSYAEVEALIVRLISGIGGELQLRTEYVADSNPALAVNQVLKLKNTTTGEVEFEDETGIFAVGAEETADFTAVAGTLHPVDTLTVGAVTVDPPGSPTAGMAFAVVDSRENAGTNNITVDFVTAGDNYYAASQNAVLATNQMYMEFVYIDATVGWISKFN